MNHIFIVGAPKAGTTCLAQWILDNNLATLLVPGIKEPYIYSRSDFGSFAIPYHSNSVLDASTSYSTNPTAIQRMPEHNTQVFFCLRNAFERSWSHFKMHKIHFINSDDSKLLISRYGFNAIDSTRIHFPAKSMKWIDGYVSEERQRILESNFLSRIEYELSFYVARGLWPIFSIINHSLYFKQLRNILSKFRVDQLHLISISALENDIKRKLLVKKAFHCDQETSIPQKNYSTNDLFIDEEKPNFNDSNFDFLRTIFKKDLEFFEKEIKITELSTDYCDIKELLQFIN